MAAVRLFSELSDESKAFEIDGHPAAVSVSAYRISLLRRRRTEHYRRPRFHFRDNFVPKAIADSRRHHSNKNPGPWLQHPPGQFAAETGLYGFHNEDDQLFFLRHVVDPTLNSSVKRSGRGLVLVVTLRIFLVGTEDAH